MAMVACGTDGSPIEPAVEKIPPFGGTIFISADIITSSDPTAFEGLAYAGQATRQMFDRRVNDWILVDAYLFDATFDDGLFKEIQVIPELGSVDDALSQGRGLVPRDMPGEPEERPHACSWSRHASWAGAAIGGDAIAVRMQRLADENESGGRGWLRPGV